MSDTSPDPKPLTADDEWLAYVRLFSDMHNKKEMDALSNEHEARAHLVRAIRIITTLRASLDTVQADARLRLAEASASLVEAEKRADKLYGMLSAAIADHDRTDEELSASEGLVAVLREALAIAVKVADEARNEWDAAPNGMKAGKLLIALSGGLKGYRPDIDKIHEVLSTTPAIRTLTHE